MDGLNNRTEGTEERLSEMEHRRIEITRTKLTGKILPQGPVGL